MLVVSGPPVVDDQGNLQTCTDHALAKCIINALHEGKYKYKVGGGLTGGRIDANQHDIVMKLNDLHQANMDGKFPIQFDQAQIETMDLNTNTKLKIDLAVEELNNGELLDRVKYEYTIVQPRQWWKPQHCMYVQSFDPKTKKFKCFNSHGPSRDQKPYIREKKVHYVNKVTIAVESVDVP